MTHSRGKLLAQVPHRVGVVWAHQRHTELVALRRAWAELVDARDACHLMDARVTDIVVTVLSALKGTQDEVALRIEYVALENPFILCETLYLCVNFNLAPLH